MLLFTALSFPLLLSRESCVALNMWRRGSLPRRACAAASHVAPRLATPRGLSVAASRMSEIEELKFLLGDRDRGSFHDFEAANVKGQTVPMSSYDGKAVLVVNVASL